MQPVEIRVVVTAAVDLGLGVAQLVERLHLRGDAQADIGNLTAQHRETAMRLIFTGGDGGQEDFQHIDVTAIGDRGLAVVLLEAVEHGIELALFFSLILPIAVHGQAERIDEAVPVADFDAFELGMGENLGRLLIGRGPIEATGQDAVAFLEAQLLRGGDAHDSGLLTQ